MYGVSGYGNSFCPDLSEKPRCQRSTGDGCRRQLIFFPPHSSPFRVYTRTLTPARSATHIVSVLAISNPPTLSRVKRYTIHNLRRSREGRPRKSSQCSKLSRISPAKNSTQGLQSRGKSTMNVDFVVAPFIPHLPFHRPRGNLNAILRYSESTLLGRSEGSFFAGCNSNFTSMDFPDKSGGVSFK